MPELPAGDVLIHAGDFSKVGAENDVKRFAEWMASLPFAHKIVIAGNHDLTFDTDFYARNWGRWHRRQVDSVATKALLTSAPTVTYLEDTAVEVCGTCTVRQSSASIAPTSAVVVAVAVATVHPGSR